MTLFDLNNEYKAFLEGVESGEILEDAIADTLEAMEGEINIKIDNIASIIKQYKAEGAAILAEITSLKERAAAKERKIEQMKRYLVDALTAIGWDKFESPKNAITFRKSKKVTISDEAAFIEWACSNNPELLKFAAPAPSNSAIGERLKAGDTIPFTALIEEKNLQLK